jgi:hypothetical protein
VRVDAVRGNDHFVSTSRVEAQVAVAPGVAQP